MKRFWQISFWVLIALVLLLLVLGRSVAHGQSTRSGGPLTQSAKQHGIRMLMPQVTGASMCQTGGGSVWLTDLSPTFGTSGTFPTVANSINGVDYQVPWALMQTGINTYAFSTFNANCPTAEFGIAHSGVIWQNESTGGASTNNFLPPWYNSIVTLATGTSITRSSSSAGTITTVATTPLFATTEPFCVMGTTSAFASFNDCGYTSSGATTANGITTITYTHSPNAGNAADTATGGFANDTKSGNAALVITAVSFAANCNGAILNCVGTVTLDGTKGSFLNTIPLPPVGGVPMAGTSYAGEQIQLSGVNASGAAIDGVYILCDSTSGVTGCANPTATSFTFFAQKQLSTNTATQGFAGNPIVSDAGCHPHTQATKWTLNFTYALENFITQLKISEDSLGFQYFRLPIGVGGENRIANSYCSDGNTCACKTDLYQDAAQSTQISDTLWQNEISTIDDYIKSQNFQTPILQSFNVLGTIANNDFGNADKMAATHVAHGFGIGSQGYQNSDITAWTNNTLTTDGDVHNVGGNDIIWVGRQYCASPQTVCEVQLVNQEDMTGANTAASVSDVIPKMLGLPLGLRFAIFEIFFQDGLSTWDIAGQGGSTSSWCPWSLVGANGAPTCTTASTNFTNFMGGNLVTTAGGAITVTVPNSTTMTATNALFNTHWTNVEACIDGSAADCSDGVKAYILSCSSTTICTLDRTVNKTAVSFKAYTNNSNLAAQTIPSYATYLSNVAKQLN